MKSRPLDFRTILLLGTLALAAVVLVVTSGAAAALAAREKCVFDDGTTIAFGRAASGVSGLGSDVWHAGNYEATVFVVSQRMQFAPLNGGLQVPSGRYTLFVDTSKRPPWTLIISKKNGEWGISYPGEKYDLGRAPLGDDLLPSAAPGFTLGCRQSQPIILWMESGRHAAYTKIWPWFPAK